MQLDEYLEEAGVTQAAFARRLGVTQGLVWQWLKKKRPIAAEKVIPIEKATDGKVSRHELRPDIYPQERRRTDLRLSPG